MFENFFFYGTLPRFSNNSIMTTTMFEKTKKLEHYKEIFEQ